MILLDTHALIWLAEGLPDLGKQARRIVDKALGQDSLSVAAISFWETAMLHQRGRVRLAQPLEIWRSALLEQGLIELPVTGDIGIAAVQLADFHADPADRLITATAVLHRATLVTADKRILTWSGILQRHNARR